MFIIKSISILVQVTLLIIFLGILCFGLFQLWTEFYLRSQLPTVQGTVTEVVPASPSSIQKNNLTSWGALGHLSYPQGNLYFIWVSFTKLNTNDSLSLVSIFPGLGFQKKGDSFPVLYNQTFPNQSRIRHSWDMLLVPILAVILGVIGVFLISCLFFWFEMFDSAKPESIYLFRSWNQWLLAGMVCGVILLSFQLPRKFLWMDFAIVQALVTGEMRLLPPIVMTKYPPAEGELLSPVELSLLTTPVLKLAYIHTIIPWFFRKRRYSDIIRYFKARETGLVSFELDERFLQRMNLKANEINSNWLQQKFKHKL